MTFVATLDTLESKIESMSGKVEHVQGTIDDMIMFSNKTHYLEEVSMLRKNNNEMRDKYRLLQDKAKLMDA